MTRRPRWIPGTVFKVTGVLSCMIMLQVKNCRSTWDQVVKRVNWTAKQVYVDTQVFRPELGTDESTQPATSIKKTLRRDLKSQI